MHWGMFVLPWNAVLALGAALLWGGGDFTGGMGVRRAGGSLEGALHVVMLSHLASFSVLAGVIVFRSLPMAHGATLTWGVAGGCVGGLSILLFYLALCRGAMGASAAVSGLLAAAIPAVVSAGLDGRPGWRHVAGFVAAGAAIWLIAEGEDEKAAPATMWLAAASGAGFGIYFVCLKFAASAGLVAAMASARVGSLGLCFAMLLAATAFPRRDQGKRWGRSVARWALGSAVMDTSGNMLFMASTRSGRLDVASVLASLYPASTILLAAWVLHEKPTLRQGWGMGIAMVAVVIIAG